MKILITGANGFLGYYLSEGLLLKKHHVIATGKGGCRLPFLSHKNFIYEEMDFTDKNLVQHILTKHHPDIIVHGGAISKPDDCETNKELAYKINTEGTFNLLNAAHPFGCFFIFISTDFVFDGVKGMYDETAIPSPVNYYGETKLLAEEKVKEYKGVWSIIRTVLVYGKAHSGRDNLLTLVKKKMENGEAYKVFTDQIRTPTYIEDLTDAIIRVIEKKANGIFHISGDDKLSPYQMVMRMADLLYLNKELIGEITADDLVQPAKRPLITGFDISKAREVLKYSPISFEEGLRKTFLDQK